MFATSPIYIDIGTSKIKAIIKKKDTVTKAWVEPIPRGAIQAGIIRDTESVEQALRRLLKQLKIIPWRQRAIITLSGGAVMIKQINFTAPKDGNTLAETIHYEAEQHFQLDISELYYDFYQLSKENESGQIPVLLVGAKRDIVDSYVKIIRNSGMRVGIIDCDVFSLANMLEYNYGKQAGLVCLVNIGASVTQIIFIENGEYIYMRDIPSGGDNFTQALSQNLAINFQQAETIKTSNLQNMQPTQGRIKEILTEAAQQFSSELMMSIDYFFKQADLPSHAESIDYLLLTGGGAQLNILPRILREATGIKTKILSPLMHVKIAKKCKPYIERNINFFGVSGGLIHRSLDEIKM